MSYCKFLWGNPCRAIETFFHWDFLPLGLRFLDAFFSSCRVEELGDGLGSIFFARLLISWRKLQLSPWEHCPFDSVRLPVPTISKNSLYTLFCPWILDHGVLLISSVSGPKILISYILLDTSFFSPSFSICDNQVLLSSDESPGHTIPIRSWVSPTLVFLICTILPRCHHVGFSS